MFIEIAKSPYLNIIGCALGILGITLAIVFYLRSRRIKLLSYTARSFTLLSNAVTSLSDFSASYRNNELKNLAVTKILLWNSGNELITSTDIANNDPVRIVFPLHARVLNANVTTMSSISNLVRADVNPMKQNEIIYSFDYLGVNEGCLVSILHTSESPLEVSLCGTIKGYGSPKSYKNIRLRKKLLNLVMIITAAVFSNSILLLQPNNPIIILALFFIFVTAMAAFMILIEDRLDRIAGGKLDEKFKDEFTPNDFAQQSHSPDG
jgi:hypothetical protein